MRLPNRSKHTWTHSIRRIRWILMHGMMDKHKKLQFLLHLKRTGPERQLDTLQSTYNHHNGLLICELLAEIQHICARGDGG